MGWSTKKIEWQRFLYTVDILVYRRQSITGRFKVLISPIFVYHTIDRLRVSKIIKARDGLVLLRSQMLLMMLKKYREKWRFPLKLAAYHQTKPEGACHKTTPAVTKVDRLKRFLFLRHRRKAKKIFCFNYLSLYWHVIGSITLQINKRTIIIIIIKLLY